MKPPKKYLKLDQIINDIINSNDESCESDDSSELEEQQKVNKNLPTLSLNAKLITPVTDEISSIDSSTLTLPNAKSKQSKDPKRASSSSNDSEENIPLSKLKGKPSNYNKRVSSSSNDSEENLPLSKLKERHESKKVSSSSDDEDIPLSKLLAKKDFKKLEEDKVKRVVPLQTIRLIKQSSIRKEKSHIEINFLKGIFNFDSLNDETIGLDDPNISLVYSDCDSNESDISYSDEYEEENDKENMFPMKTSSKNKRCKSPILILENSNKFILSIKNLKRKINC